MNPTREAALSVHQKNLLAASRAAAGRVREAADERAGDRPRPGDLYLLDATADFPVHWLLLDPADARGAFRAVPADTHPLLGPHDLLVESPLGPLRLRPSATVEILQEALRPELCRGALPASELDRARRSGTRGGADEPRGKAPLPRDLEEWMEGVIHPAEVLAASAVPVPPRELPAPRSQRRGIRTFALAAGLLGLLGAGWLGWQGWDAEQHRQEARLEAERQAAERTLLAERTARTRERAAIEAALKERTAIEQRLRQRNAELEGAAKSGEPPLLNLPVAILYPAHLVRGEEAESYRWPPEAPYLTVVLKLAESETYPRYRVVVRPAGKPRILWQSDSLTLSGQGALQLALSREILPAGSYRISAQGLGDGRSRDLAEYELRISR